MDFVIEITQLCYMLHYLTSCSIDWCGGFAANFVVIIQITQLFILKFHLNLKGVNARGLSFSYCSKKVAAETNCQFWLYYHKFTDFVFWIIEIHDSLDCLISCSIDRFGGPTINWGCFNYLRCATSDLILLQQTSKQAKLSISYSRNFTAETRY